MSAITNFRTLGYLTLFGDFLLLDSFEYKHHLRKMGSTCGILMVIWP